MINIKQIRQIIFAFLFLSVCTAHAFIEDRKVITWNLQGSSAATESKWRNNVAAFLRGPNRASVIALQEAGTPPSTAVLMPQLNFATTPQLININVAIPIDEYMWNLGSELRPDYRYIYFSRTDLGANRVNIAIVTEERAERVIVLPPPFSYASARPIIGIQLGGDIYFSIHASASSGADSVPIIRAVDEFVRRDNFRGEFMIMGDWNVSPSDLSERLRRSDDRRGETLSRNLTINTQESPTQISGGTLDYAVSGSLDTALRSRMQVFLATASLAPQLASDHYPVQFVIRDPLE